MVDSASEDTVAADEDCAVVTLAADSSADFLVTTDTHTGSVLLFTVRRTDVAGDASVVGVVAVIDVADTEDTVKVAVGRTGVV